MLKNYFPTLSIAMLIFVLSLMPTKNIHAPDLFENQDKLIHFLMYGFLSSIAFFDLVRIKQYSIKKHLCFSFFIIAYSFLLETMQHYLTSYRSFELLDFFSNSAGACCAFIFWYFAVAKRTFKKNISTD